MKSNNRPSNILRSNAFDVIPVWLRGWKGLWVFGAAVYTLVYSIWIVLKWTDPAHELLIANLGYISLGCFSAISAIYTINRHQVDRRTRGAWQFLALGLIFLVIADIIHAALEATIGVGFPAIPDFFYLAFYPLMFIGLITIPTQLSDRSQEKTWKLDLAIITTGATAIFWFFIIAPTAAAGGEGWAVRLVAGAYPAMDVLLLASIASLLFRKSEINTRQSLYILGFGLLSYAIADIAYAWLVLQDLYYSGALVDVIWTISYFLIGLAALRQATPYLVRTPTTDHQSHTNWLASILPFLVVVASVIISLYSTLTGHGPGIQTNGLLFGTILAIILMMARQVITMRENSRLANELNLASDELRTSATILEERVAERTRKLESQTLRLRVAAEIARDAASARNLSELLVQATELICNRFNFYHAGIFLLDNNKDYAVLVASPTEAGKKMIENNHKLRVGEIGIVGRVAATGEHRVMLNTGTDAVYFNNPYLPNTRSEMALPLKVENNVIGVLDVQSDQPQAFNEDDLAIMQILADQLAAAIERTRLLQEVERNLKELESAYGRFTTENWKKLSDGSLTGSKGYRFDNIRIEPITELSELADNALKTGMIISSNGSNPGTDREHKVAIPIKLRGQTIGVVSLKLKEGYDSNTISVIELATERLASAMESARLYGEARLLADREQSISRVTTAISASTEYEQILQTTVREIGSILSDTEVTIQILEQPTAGKQAEQREP